MIQRSPIVTRSIFEGNVLWRKHPGRFALREPELLSYRKPTYSSKRVVQNKKNGHKNPINYNNFHDEIKLYQGINDLHINTQ